MDKNILTQIKKWAQSATYMPKFGNKEVRAHSIGYEQGLADAKKLVLDIINSEN